MTLESNFWPTREKEEGRGKKRDVTFRARNRGNDNGGRNMAEGEPLALALMVGRSGILDVMSPLRYKVRGKAHNPTALSASSRKGVKGETNRPSKYVQMS